MTTNTPAPFLTDTARPASAPRALLLATLLTSALIALLGAAWALAPDAELLGGPPDRTPLELLLGPTGAAATLAAVSLLGVGAALTALARRLSRPVLLIVAAAQVLVAGVGMGSMSTLSTAGYLLALAMPAVVGLLVVQVIRRYPRLRVPVAGIVVIALAAGALFLGEALRDLAGYLLPAFVAEIPMIATTLLLVAVGALWAALAAAALRSDGSAARVAAQVTRHRVPLTLVAAACPLPYALIRLSWLTPWPLMAPDGLELSTRLWGLALSSGSWLAVVLTLGLILPWGERFPRWMPVVAGRKVPIAAAAVPGGAVAALFTFAAVPMLVGAEMMTAADRLLFAVTYPCWLWGPALALAVWGYIGHRRDQGRRGSAPEVAGARRA